MTQPTIFDRPPAELLDAATSVQFYCPGNPAPQGSKRAFRNQHTGRIQLTESSKNVGPWRERVAIAAHNAMAGQALFDGPVSVLLSFVMPRPKSTPKSRTPPAVKRPDVDKLARAAMDSLTGVCFSDDAQVVILHAWKRIAEIGETAGVDVRVEAES